MLRHRLFAHYDHAHNARLDSELYGQRWMAETAFSGIKRRFCPAFPPHAWYREVHEFVLTVTVYNHRDAARRISDIRDAHAAIETFDQQLKRAGKTCDVLNETHLTEIRATLIDRRNTMAAEQGVKYLGVKPRGTLPIISVEHRLTEVQADIRDGQKRVADLPIATEGYDAVAGGLRKSYKRARNRMQEAYADPTFERFHEWRKRIKYHRYHTRLLRRVWVGPMKSRRAELKELSDIIGYENDLAEFDAMIHDEELFTPKIREALSGVITAKRSEFHRQGRPLSERLFAEAPDKLVARIGDSIADLVTISFS